MDAFKPHLAERLKAGVWNVQVLLRELKQRGYQGGYTILKDIRRLLQQDAAKAPAARPEPSPGAGRPSSASRATIEVVSE